MCNHNVPQGKEGVRAIRSTHAAILQVSPHEREGRAALARPHRMAPHAASAPSTNPTVPAMSAPWWAGMHFVFRSASISKASTSSVIGRIISKIFLCSARGVSGERPLDVNDRCKSSFVAAFVGWQGLSNRGNSHNQSMLLPNVVEIITEHPRSALER